MIAEFVQLFQMNELRLRQWQWQVPLSLSTKEHPDTQLSPDSPAPFLYKKIGSSLMAYWVKDAMLSLMWWGFDPWPLNFCMPQVYKKKKSHLLFFIL